MTGNKTQKKSRRKMLKMLLLNVFVLVMGAGSVLGSSMPGSWTNISSDDRDLQPLVLDAACHFNNKSNDAFLFKPTAILTAQRQVVNGFRYFIDLEISRTVCRKQEKNNNLSECRLQPIGPLQETFSCEAEILTTREKHETQIRVKCEPLRAWTS